MMEGFQFLMFGIVSGRNCGHVQGCKSAMAAELQARLASPYGDIEMTGPRKGSSKMG
jgi:hypothetical protein